MWRRLLLSFLLLFSTLLFADVDDNSTGEEHNVTVKPLTHEVIPVAKTLFKVIDLRDGNVSMHDLSGQDFIVVSVREKGSDGRFYAVDRDGTVWMSGAVTSGAVEYRSPSGVFKILEKQRYHMSSEYPDESGVNNMDFMMRFTRFGHALHKGSVNWMSHGCIHIDPKEVPVLFRWSQLGMPVVITRHSYMPFAKEDLRKIYLGED